MVFQLDYLVNKDEFSQLTLQTNQAVLLSLFLQSIASEILRDLGRTSPGSYRFNDELQSKAIENLEVFKTNSIISDEYSVLDPSAGGDHGACREVPRSLFGVISVCTLQTLKILFFNFSIKCHLTTKVLRI